MGQCHDMKKGQIYTCGTCGLELKVLAECESCCEHEGQDACSTDEFNFICCGEPLKLKE
jgi:hypothetical protein